MNAQLKSVVAADATDLHALLALQRAAHARAVPGYAERMDDLARLRAAFKRRLEDMAAAVSADFGRRSRHESLLSDGMTVLHDIDYARRHLRDWMRTRPSDTHWLFWPARGEVRYQPLGVVGVIAPWNYPVNLALMPLVAALAAGNHVMIKPSEHTPRTAEFLRDLFAELFPRERVATVLGGADVAAQFAALQFDHLFFTGSTAVGKLVMAAAAPNLTPVTLELGGKSPTIIAPDYPLGSAVPRIAFGKCFNAGQTCIAPDYVLLPSARMDAFVDAYRDYVTRCYPTLADNADYTAIVNDRQFARLTRYLDDARAKGARVIELGAHDAARRVFAPTLVLNANDNMLVMQEEIFGPILPLVPTDTVDAAIDYINARPRPLALYHFDHDRARTERVLERTIAGGVAVNDTLLQFAQTELPFGGVGPAGMGQYHGRAGFLAFSKEKPVFYQGRMSSLSLFRPPYRRIADWIIRFVTR